MEEASNNNERPVLGSYWRLWRFIAAWALSEIVLIGAIQNFVDNLNKQGVISLGDNFTPTQVFWGDGIGLNLLRLVVLTLFAGVFGILYGYFVREVKERERLVVSVANTILAVFGTLIFLMMAYSVGNGGLGVDLSVLIGSLASSIFSSTLYSTFIILQLVLAFAATYYSLGYGVALINNSNTNSFDEKNMDTLLGIKWYHYLWLWIPIGFYGQMFIRLIYIVGKVVIGAIGGLKWFDFLGMGAENNSLSTIWGSIMVGIIIAAIAASLLTYLREILSGERAMHPALKVIVSIVIGLVIPICLILFTSL